MNIVFPHNIYTNLLMQVMPQQIKQQVSYAQSSLLAKMLEEKKADVVLLPVMDLLRHQNFYVSAYRGISFDGLFSNSYLYFRQEQQHVKSLSLAGDVSSVEAVLSKILLSEMYDEDVQISLVQENRIDEVENLLLVGDKNFSDSRYSNGLSFSEEIAELISLRFVNYVLAAREEQPLRDYVEATPDIENLVFEEVAQPNWDFRLDPETKEFFRENIHHLVYEFDEFDEEGVRQVLRLPYFHGLIDDLFEVKFVR